MINISDLVDGLVAALRGVPELSAEFGPQGANIYAYHDRFPQSSNLRLAISEMPAHSILVCWARTDPGIINQSVQWLDRKSVV